MSSGPASQGRFGGWASCAMLDFVLCFRANGSRSHVPLRNREKSSLGLVCISILQADYQSAVLRSVVKLTSFCLQNSIGINLRKGPKVKRNQQ